MIIIITIIIITIIFAFRIAYDNYAKKGGKNKE